LNANAISVSSSPISHSPRTSAKRATAPRSPLRARCRYTDAPARNTNVGAHRCVTQRVANSATVVRAGSVGEYSSASVWK
jgi:hypothetical protein